MFLNSIKRINKYIFALNKPKINKIINFRYINYPNQFLLCRNFSIDSIPVKPIPYNPDDLKPNPKIVDTLLTKLKELGINDAGKEKLIQNEALSGNINEVFELYKMYLCSIKLVLRIMKKKCNLLFIV